MPPFSAFSIVEWSRLEYNVLQIRTQNRDKIIMIDVWPSRRFAVSDTRLKLLVVDDDEFVVSGIRVTLPSHWCLTHVSDPQLIPKDQVSAAFVDMHLTDNLDKAEGLEVIQKLRSGQPHLEIVAISGDLDRNLMESCLKAGASRFLAKPLSAEEVLLTLEKIEALLLLRDASSRSQHQSTPWIGSSAASGEVHRTVAQLKGEIGPILIEGESGTGKEVAASLIHLQENPSRPFISVNVAALPESVFESEFFGHNKGAFTGADKNKMGLAEAAHGGDLFLDEVEALPAGLQAKLLRFLESGEIRRVGSKESVQVQVRVIAATNQNLETLVAEGKFREDLLWRLNGKKLLLPPLRLRKEDIGELAQFFLEKERPRRNKKFEPDAIEAMKAHHWPGNVRELKRVCEQLCLYSPLPLIRQEDVLKVLPIRTLPGEGANASSLIPDSPDLSLGLSQLLHEFEEKILRLALDETKDIDRVSQKLGISRSSLYKKLRDHKIESRGNES